MSAMTVTSDTLEVGRICPVMTPTSSIPDREETPHFDRQARTIAEFQRQEPARLPSRSSFAAASDRLAVLLHFSEIDDAHRPESCSPTEARRLAAGGSDARSACRNPGAATPRCPVSTVRGGGTRPASHPTVRAGRDDIPATDYSVSHSPSSGVACVPVHSLTGRARARTDLDFEDRFDVCPLRRTRLDTDTDGLWGGQPGSRSDVHR